MRGKKRGMAKLNNSTMDNLSHQAEKQNRIPMDLYQKYEVKRGLRNEDGSGVLVGLTEIGDVHGYIFDEGERVPVDGRLLYRGINITELAKGFQKDRRFGFEEATYLLLFGDLPKRRQLVEFRALLGANRTLPDGFIENMILKSPSRDVVNKLARSVLVSYSYDPNPDDISIKNVLRQCLELIARFPTMVAYGYQAKRHYFDGKSLFIHRPRPELSTAENLLHLIRPDSSFTRLEAETLDLALVIHAEHGGGNNSTFTTHVVSSTGTDTYSAIAAAVGSLKGPLHGGANLKVMDMMKTIQSNVTDLKDDSEIKNHLTKILRKRVFDRKGLIYGIGHAVYTLSDPRATLLRQKAEALAKAKGQSEEFDLYQRVARLAAEVIQKEKASAKSLTANVDFYSGFVYKMLDIPLELYTPIFCIARIAGWTAHRIEEIISGGRIIRPAYRNVVRDRDYVTLNKR